MAQLVVGEHFHVVTWAPTTDQHRQHRGFDQAELLARVFAKELSLPCRTLLKREPGPAQTGLSASERSVGPQMSSCSTAAELRGLRVLLVDDVVTTGATLSAAGKALKQVGASRVLGVAAAHPAGANAEIEPWPEK